MKAYSKINLALDVGELNEETGLHPINTVMQTIDLHDNVTVYRRSDKECTSVFTAGQVIEDDNALKAAKLFVQTFGTNGVDIQIGKIIPMSSGLGGSSTDAAAVLNAMAMLYSVPQSELLPLAAQIGSDVPFFLHTGIAHVTGYGEIVTPLDPLPLMYALLVFPSQRMSSAEAYYEYDRMRKKPAAIRSEDIYGWLHEGKNTKLFTNNSLYPAVSFRLPSLRTAYNDLEDITSIHQAMTGSGTCLYALFPKLERAYKKLENLQEKGYMAKICRLIN